MITTFRTAVLAAFALTGCASAPREFEPQLTQPASDQAAYQAAFVQCRADVETGKRSNFRASRGTSAGVGLGVGAGAGAVMASSAASGAGMLAGPAAAVALGAGMLIFAPIAIYGTSRAIRAGKEKEIKAAMGACLAEEGYAVADWRLPPRPARRAARSAAP